MRVPFALSIGTCLGCSGVAGLSIVFGVRGTERQRERERDA